ncbi:hypothetical protein BDV33DRAFT_201474 [Aspergillus novoparasiticus]|uniref:Uncharacterized protein n=1 Tax=Aspergillus novoparasiticus TaxID=986946 RepID=A0A5N6EYA8_9EURO|nr:hypothetical protein BDV33DRAFT_201474 [Aspergillus novoparasiticus]
MASKQRISFASIRPFEDIGVQNIGTEMNFVLDVPNGNSANIKYNFRIKELHGDTKKLVKQFKAVMTTLHGH